MVSVSTGLSIVPSFSVIVVAVGFVFTASLQVRVRLGFVAMALLVSCAFIEKPKHRVSFANVSVVISACAASLQYRVFSSHDLTVLLLFALLQG